MFHIWFPKEPFSEQFSKEPYFLNGKNIKKNLKNPFCYKQASVELKGYLDVKRSSWNQRCQ